MADVGISFDMSEFNLKSAELLLKFEVAKKAALKVVADELLRLSQREVPFVSGELMSSGVSQESGKDSYIVGYNKVYAAYMHEGHWHDGSHEIKHYSNRRKGKYLEDPMKMNKHVFTQYFGRTIKVSMGMI